MENNENLELEQPTSQDGSENTLAEILGDELGVDLTTKTADTEQDISQDPPAVTDESNQDYSITEEQLGELKELGYEEADLDNLEPSDLENILETKTAKPTETAGIDTAKLIITPEMAERYGGIAKSFVGKPVDELFKAVEQNNKYVQKLEGELKQHQSKLTEKENQKVDELLNELKTSTDLSEEDFWKKHGELVSLQVRALAQAEAEKPQQEAQALAFMQSAMPEGVEFKTAFDEWSKSLDPESLAHFKASNDFVIREAVKNFVLLNQNKANLEAEKQRLANEQAQAESKAKILAAKKAADAIKKSNGQRMAGSKYHVIKRGANSNVDYSGLDGTAAEILRDSLE